MSTREISAGAHSRPLASHNGHDTQPDPEFLFAGVFDPAVKAIAATFFVVGAAVILARLSFFFF